MKVAVAQISPSVGKNLSNKEKIIEKIAIAENQEADIIVFGELSLTTPCIFDMPNSKKFIDELWFDLSEIAEYTKNIDVLIGVPSYIDGEVFSSAIHIKNGEIVKEFNKAMILNKGDMRFIAGAESEVFEQDTILENIINVNGEEVLVAIGEDLSFIEDLECVKGINTVLHLDATKYRHGIGYDRITLQQEIARKTDSNIISTNIVGASEGVVYYGNSCVCDYNGNLIVELRSFEEELVIVEVEALEEYKPLTVRKLTPKGKSRETYKAAVVAISDYMVKNNFEKIVLGLSGGIDSAVVLALAVEAVGANNIDVLLMPSQYSSQHSVDDAIALAKNLGVKYHTVGIEDCFGSILNTMAPLFIGTQPNVTEENIQSRLRGVLLMAFSNKFGAIVLNTSNKSEIAMGYGTLYGDTNGAISILGDLYKKEVYDLARYINRDEEIIPINIINKEPSAELRPDQKDSDSLPPYDILDKVLYMMIEEGKDDEDIIEEGMDSDLVYTISRLLKNNEYKRRQLPPVVQMSTAVLGVDRIMPIY